MPTPTRRNPYPDPQQVEHLKHLAAVSARTVGSDPADHPRRVAGDEFARTIATIRDSATPPYTYRELGEPLGIRPLTIRSKLARRGYENNPPSQPRYVGHTYRENRRTDTTFSCGHPRTEENSYWNKTLDKDVCATCQRRYHRNYIARQKQKAQRQDSITKNTKGDTA